MVPIVSILLVSFVLLVLSKSCGDVDWQYKLVVAVILQVDGHHHNLRVLSLGW